MQGQLWQRNLAVTIETACGHCGQPLSITLDNELRFTVEGGAEPLVFEPHIDWQMFSGANILDAY